MARAVAEAARTHARPGDTRSGTACRSSRRGFPCRPRRTACPARDGTFQLTPAPKKKPFFVCAVMPRSRVMFSVSATKMERLPSMPMSGVVPLSVAPSFDGMSPFNSAVTRSQFRDGNPRPAPQRNAPPGCRSPTGGAAPFMPPKPESSTSFAASLLTIRSTEKSGLPVLTPASFLPVGSLTMPRNASAAGSWRDSDQRLNFAPT